MRAEAQVCPHRILDHSISPDEVRDPRGVAPEGPEGFPGAGYVPPRVDQESEGELMVLTEAGVLSGFFGVDPDDLQSGLLDPFVVIAHSAGLACAYGSKILWVEVDQGRPIREQVGEPYQLAVFIAKLEIGGLLAFFKHAIS